MNRVFKIIWSQAQRTWVVASELAHHRGKGGGAVDKRPAVSEITLNRETGGVPPPALVSPLRLGILMALLATGQSAQAVDYWWDTNGATPGAGGATPTGTWSTGNATLSTDSTGSIPVGLHTTTTADSLTFSAGGDATGSFAVTVDGTQDINWLYFEEGLVDLTGGTINFGSTSGLIQNVGSGTATISATLTGTNGVRFREGTVVLTATNTYTGTTFLGTDVTMIGVVPPNVNMTLAAAGGNSISGNLLRIGSILQYTEGGSVTLGANEQVNDAATLEINSAHYGGSATFSLNGFNETLAGVNMSHRGNTSISTLQNGAATDVTLTLTGSGTYTTAAGDRLAGRNIIDGGAGKLNIVVALTGTGNQTFAGTDPRYTGTTTVNSGTLHLWNTSQWASDVILNGGVLDLFQTSAGAGPGAQGYLAGAATRDHTNIISGTGGTLRKSADGTVILSGANTYQGATLINEGTLRAGSATAFGNNSAVTLADVASATMDLNNFDVAIGSLAGGGTTGGNVTLGTGNLTTGGNGTSTSYGGVISGTGALTKVGGGTQTLTNANTYSGLTTVNAGTLELGNGGTTGNIASAQANVAAGAALAVNRSDAFTLNQVVNGDGTLVQRGGGTTTMAQNSDIDHVRLEQGTLVTPAALTTDDVTFTDAGGATLQVTGTLQTAAAGQAVVTGGLGVDTVLIEAGGNMLANGNLGAGNDTLDVVGTLNTGGGVFALGDGDDNFVVHDGTVVTGTVDGGAGLDTRTYNINTTANLGALTNFEGVTKTGTGDLNITGPGATDLQEVQVLEGTLNVQAGASIVATPGQSLNSTVASGAVLNVDGAFGCGGGDDTLTISGTIRGSGTVDLCAGDDTLFLNDGAVLEIVIDGNVPTQGSDTVVLNSTVTTDYDLNMIVNFEHLVKNNTNEAILNGSGNFPTDTAINGGTLTVNGQLGTPVLTMADDTVLNVNGTLQAVGGGNTAITGSAGVNTVNVGAGGNLSTNADFGGGDDVFTSSGTVAGSMAFGDGNDTATFSGGNIAGLTALDGGADTDTLTFQQLAVNADTLAITNWEALNLLNNSSMTLSSPLDLNGGLMTIDGSSTLTSGNGASIGGSVNNAGLINTGASRLAISGDYTGNGGRLSTAVSPVNGTGGGLDVTGQATGTTAVIFNSDGSEATGPTNILVVSSSNSPGGSFTATDAQGGIVRLNGSAFPWAFARAGDNNWYLNTQAGGPAQPAPAQPAQPAQPGSPAQPGPAALPPGPAGLLPEIPAYATLPVLGLLSAAQGSNLVQQRLDGLRGDLGGNMGTGNAEPGAGDAQREHCNLWEPEQRTTRGAGNTLMDDCQGFWVAASYSELKLGNDPGFDMDGDNYGIFIGLDGAQDLDDVRLRLGVYAGYLNGDYRTSGRGADVTFFSIIGADIDYDTPVLGLYSSAEWNNGFYLQGVLSGQDPDAEIHTDDGFRQNLDASTTIDLSVRAGYRYALQDNWVLEPNLQLAGTWVEWENTTDKGGKRLNFDNQNVGTARLGLRVEKQIITASGSLMRPWASLAVEDSWGDSDDSLAIVGSAPDGSNLGIPNYDLGTFATIDLGVEGQVSPQVTVFGAISAGRDISGSTRKVEGAANVGFRVSW